MDCKPSLQVTLLLPYIHTLYTMSNPVTFGGTIHTYGQRDIICERSHMYCVALVLTDRSTSASTNTTPSNRFINDSLYGHGARPGWRLLILARGEVGKTTSLLVAHVV